MLNKEAATGWSELANRMVMMETENKGLKKKIAELQAEKTTCFIKQKEFCELDIWQCEQCKDEWYFEFDLEGENINYCPNCGRKIIDYKAVEQEAGE